VDDDGNPQAVEPPQQPSGEDILLKKAVEVVTKGKSDVVSNGQGDAKSQDHLPILTPLNVPTPSNAPPQ